MAYIHLLHQIAPPDSGITTLAEHVGAARVVVSCLVVARVVVARVVVACVVVACVVVACVGVSCVTCGFIVCFSVALLCYWFWGLTLLFLKNNLVVVGVA